MIIEIIIELCCYIIS